MRNSSRSFFLIAKLAYFDLASPITTAARQFIGAVSIGSCEGRSGHACCRVPHQPTLHPVYCFGLPMRFAGRVLCRRGRPLRAGDGLTRQKTSMQSRCAYRRRVIRIESKHPHEGYQLDWTPHGDPQHPVQQCLRLCVLPRALLRPPGRPRRSLGLGSQQPYPQKLPVVLV